MSQRTVRGSRRVSTLTSRLENEQAKCLTKLCETAPYDMDWLDVLQGPIFDPNPKGFDVKTMISIINQDLARHKESDPSRILLFSNPGLDKLVREGWSQELRTFAHKVIPVFFDSLQEYKQSLPQTPNPENAVHQFLASFDSEEGKRFIRSWDMKTFLYFVQSLFARRDISSEDLEAINEITLERISPLLNATDMYLLLRGLPMPITFPRHSDMCRLWTLKARRDQTVPKKLDLLRERLLQTLEKDVRERKWESKIDSHWPLNERLTRYCEMKGSNENLCEAVQAISPCLFDEGLYPGSTGYKLAQASFEARKRTLSGLGKRKAPGLRSSQS
jgi:hypothetical protein